VKGVLLAGAVLSAGMVAAAPALGAGTHRVPRSIAADCSADVTPELTAWIGSVPDRSALAFKRGGCYRIEGTLEIADRRRLVLNGNGATFKATTVGATGRSQWRVVRGAHIVLRSMRVRGANPAGGSFNPSLQHQHAFDLAGAKDVEIHHVRASGLYGDCFYVGRDHDPPHRWSSGIRVRASSCARSGRMGVAVVAGRRVEVKRTRFSRIARTVLDVEPNGAGFGARHVRFVENAAFGELPGGFFSAIGDGPVDDVVIARNTVTGAGMYMAVLAPPGQRRSNIRITGNSSDTGHHAPGSAALDFERVDGLTVARNAIPVSGPNMALASVLESCDVTIAGNLVSRGSREARIAPFGCDGTAG
jgi:hypothetical protein